MKGVWKIHFDVFGFGDFNLKLIKNCLCVILGGFGDTVIECNIRCRAIYFINPSKKLHLCGFGCLWILGDGGASHVCYCFGDRFSILGKKCFSLWAGVSEYSGGTYISFFFFCDFGFCQK